MLRFYWQLVKRMPGLLWSSAGRLEKGISVTSLVLTVFGATPLWPFSPLWALVPIGLLFLYGLMKANYERFATLKAEHAESEKSRRLLEARVVELEAGVDDDSRLRARCRRLSDEIYDFLGDRRRADASIEDWLEGTHSASEQEQHRSWEREVRGIHRHSAETIARYSEKFEGRIMAVLDALEQRGQIDAIERARFEHPTNEHGIRYIAQRLGAIGYGDED